MGGLLQHILTIIPWMYRVTYRIIINRAQIIERSGKDSDWNSSFLFVFLLLVHTWEFVQIDGDIFTTRLVVGGGGSGVGRR